MWILNVVGPSDPDGDEVTAEIESVFQDEAVGSDADGSFAGEVFAVRAERLGNGDGRVYHVGFTATDGRGGECSGTVTVAVPQDQGNNGTVIDGGPLNDSTVAD